MITGNMICYRAKFHKDIKCNYWQKWGVEGGPFADVHKKNWPTLFKIYVEADKLGINYIWHFYEPFVELTWICDPAVNKKFTRKLKLILKKANMNDLELETGFPKPGFKPDWFCNNDGEMAFGAYRHALSARMVRIIEGFRTHIEAGLGIEEQVGRNIHTVCNPLGLTYKEEGRICWSRGLMCYLYWYLPPKVARFLYVKVFRQKLPK